MGSSRQAKRLHRRTEPVSLSTCGSARERRVVDADQAIAIATFPWVSVDDLAAATEFFVELGLVLQGEWSVEGRWVDRIVGLEGVRADAAMLQTPDGNGRLELVKFHSPSNQGDNRTARPTRTPRKTNPTGTPTALSSYFARDYYARLRHLTRLMLR